MPANISLSESARLRLEALINDGVLMPGDAIDELALAARFGVSRTPVREAVRELQLQGLVQVVPRHGTYVARMSVKSLLAMFELLAELEGICAKLAARRLDPAGRQRLEQAWQSCRVASERADPELYGNANLAFHEVIYLATNNRFLVEQVKQIRRRTQMYRRTAFQQVGRMATSLADHERIVSAVVQGDAEAAALAARTHIAIGGQGFAEFVSTLPDESLLLPDGERTVRAHARDLPAREPVIVKDGAAKPKPPRRPQSAGATRKTAGSRLPPST